MPTRPFHRCLSVRRPVRRGERGKGAAWAVLSCVLLSVGLRSDGQAAPPFHGSLFTPVSQKNAIGPAYTGPMAYYPYEPRDLGTWQDIASGVREKVAAHLTKRLGKTFYERLKFAGGEAVNLDELHRVLPASRKIRREVPTYLLWFEFEMPEVGIRVYTASMELRRDGSVLREIDLPPFAAEPEKLKFTPLGDVAAALISKGAVDAKTTTATIVYDDKHAQIVWRFEQVLPGNGPVVNVKNIDVNANTGAILRRYTDHGSG